jgi:deoxyadenosine/deoxycytidine kinase
MTTDAQLSIGIVGPCATGKSTLAQALNEHGFGARQIVQEHSYVPDMWKVISKPDYLIYLDASFEVCSQRKTLLWNRSEFEEQIDRLAHARMHCDLYLMTDELTEELVLKSALQALEARAATSSSTQDR